MANMVILNGKRFLVDVGYGADGPVQAVLLSHGNMCLGLNGQYLKVEQQRLSQHQDADQRVWVYFQQRAAEHWRPVYHFLEAEFFCSDFTVLNHYAMTQSRWSRTVLAQKFVFGSDERLSGSLLLVRDELRSGNGTTNAMTLVAKLQDEQMRLETLKRYFGIALDEQERFAIRAKPTCLDSVE